MSVCKIYREGLIDYLWFWCPGCKTNHRVSVTGDHAWKWNNSVNKPTLQPSIKVTGGHDEKYICHSFVTDGKIEFLGDCTHELAGKTIDLEDEE